MKKAGLMIAALLVSNVALAQYDVLEDELTSPPSMPEPLSDLPSEDAVPAMPHPMMPSNHPMMKGEMATPPVTPAIPAVNAPTLPVNHPTLQQQVAPRQHPVMPANHPTMRGTTPLPEHPMMPANHPTLQDAREPGTSAMPKYK